MANDLVGTSADFKEEEALKTVENRLSAKEGPLTILDDARHSGQIDETIRKYIGADAYGKDAIGGVSLAKQWIGGK